MDLKLELIVLPVSDVDRAKAFYQAVGFQLDVDNTVSGDYRVVHFTPPGSECSIIFGTGMTSAAPGSVQGLYLVVFDIEEARAELVGRGIDVGEVFHDAGWALHHGHDAGGVVHHGAGQERVAGPHPARADYASYLTFSDPDGNGWVLQEVKRRIRPPLTSR
ncbi:VOC family protein [Streptomyces sp. NPDC059680]|uniref:VOC family protein n=1 Tax=Streptomyces sp. NPDC059680 TaxID=3346904 RepID=UPI0036B14633